MAFDELYDWYQQFREENQWQIMEYRRETQQWIASLKKTTGASVRSQEKTRLETNQSFETLCELIRGMTKKETTPPVVLEDSVTSSERNHSRIPQEDDRGHPTEDSQVTRDNVFVVKIKENATPSSTNRELEVPAGSVLRTLQPELVNENEGEPELVSDEQITNSSQEINSNLHIVQEKSKGLQHHCESSKVIPPPLQDVIAEVASKELGKLVELLIELIEIRLANGRTSSMTDIGLCPMEFLEIYDAQKLFVETPREGSLLQIALVKGKICVAKESRLIGGADRRFPYLINFDLGGSFHFIDCEMNEGKATNMVLGMPTAYKFFEVMHRVVGRILFDLGGSFDILDHGIDEGRIFDMISTDGFGYNSVISALGSFQFAKGHLFPPFSVLYDRGRAVVTLIVPSNSFILVFDPGGFFLL